MCSPNSNSSNPEGFTVGVQFGQFEPGIQTGTALQASLAPAFSVRCLTGKASSQGVLRTVTGVYQSAYSHLAVTVREQPLVNPSSVETYSLQIRHLSIFSKSLGNGELRSLPELMGNRRAEIGVPNGEFGERGCGEWGNWGRPRPRTPLVH